MPLPIVLIHRVDDSYLSYSLQQAKVSNPESPVYLIGTAANQKYAAFGIRHAMIDAYMRTASAFAPNYKHSHVMSYEYNLFCFQRWFLLRDFMRHNQIPSCCYIDSDVMLYEDVSKPIYSDFMMEFVWTNFVNLDILDRFCLFITAQFANPGMYEQLVQETKQMGHMSKNLPLVSDMVVGLLFLRQFPQYVYTHGQYGDSLFDENINRPIWAESLEDKRKIYLKDGQLYTRDVAKNKYIRLNSLHFQGLVMKEFMPYFFTPYLSQKGSFSFDYQTRRWVPALLT